MKIFELLDSKVNFETIRNTEKSFWSLAKIGNREIEFRASKEYGADDTELWDILFLERIPNGTTKDGKPSYENTFSLTGSGNPLEVGSMIISSLKEFDAQYHPMHIQFSADKSEGSRAKIYRRFMVKALPNFKEDSSSLVDTGPDEIIRFDRV